MDFHLSVSLTYKEIFNDYEGFDLAKSVSQIPSISALEVLGYVLAQLHTKERSSKTQIEILKIWLSRVPLDVRQRISVVIDEINKEAAKNISYSGDFNFANNISCLKLIQEVFANYNGSDAELTPEQELLLLKSYLFVSQKWTDEQADSVKGMATASKEEFAKFFLHFHMPYADLFEFKDFRLQVIKAIYFFKFCEKNPQFGEYLEIFLKDASLSSWSEYLINILSTYVRKFEPLKTPSIISFGDDETQIIPWLKELSIDSNTYKPKADFLELREKPVFEVRENEFLFLNLNFLIDKIYQGIQFDFARALVKNKAQYKGKPIKDYPQFKSIYGTEFSENYMFYEIMRYAFKGKKLVKQSGEELKAILGDGEPDFYIRDKGKVYVFEYKDIIIAAKAKQSSNVDEKVDEIFMKLVKNKSASDKGVTQLVNTIKKIRKGDFAAADSGISSNSIIYPIIVHTDFSLQVPGVNTLLNSEFRTQIKDAGFETDDNIKSLTLWNIDNLIKFQDLFRDNRLKLNNCLNGYHESLYSNNRLLKIASFDVFLHDKAAEMDYESPKMMMEELQKILPE